MSMYIGRITTIPSEWNDASCKCIFCDEVFTEESRSDDEFMFRGLSDKSIGVCSNCISIAFNVIEDSY